MDGLEVNLERIRAGLTLWQLGNFAGIHPTGISEMERGQRAIAEAVVAVLDDVPGMVVEMAGMGETEEVSA